MNIKSVANKFTVVWRGSVEKNKAKLIVNVKISPEGGG